MSRSLAVTGDSLVYVLYASVLAALGLVLYHAVLPLDGPGSVALAVFLASLAAVVVLGAWRRLTGRDGQHLGTVEDITYDPFADPGQAARHRWLRSIRRLRSRNDEED